MSIDQTSQKWNDGLRLVSYCPVCETRYNPMEAQLLGEDGETRLIHVQCRKCQHSILALVLVSQVGASSVGLLTDLSYEDVLRFRSNRLVSINDVIDVHDFLDNIASPDFTKTHSHKTARIITRKEKRRG